MPLTPSLPHHGLGRMVAIATAAALPLALAACGDQDARSSLSMPSLAPTAPLPSHATSSTTPDAGTSSTASGQQSGTVSATAGPTTVAKTAAAKAATTPAPSAAGAKPGSKASSTAAASARAAAAPTTLASRGSSRTSGGTSGGSSGQATSNGTRTTNGTHTTNGGTAASSLVGAVHGSTSASGPTAVRLSGSSFWTRSIASAPLAPNSAAVAANVRNQITSVWNGVAAFNVREYNAPFYVVPAGTPRVRVGYHDCQDKGRTPAGLYGGAQHFVDVPVPTHAIPAAGLDGSMTIYDPAADKVWEFWKMRKTSTGSWAACYGGRIDNASSNQGMFPFPYGTSATGLLRAAGMVSLADMRRGSINHAMIISVRSARAMPYISWPALRGDGASSDPNAPMEGQRLRLDPNLDLSKYDLSPIGLMVARAAQKYGFIIADKGGSVAVLAESGSAEKSRTGVDPWDRYLTDEPHRIFTNFPWDHIQVIQKDWGKP